MSQSYLIKGCQRPRKLYLHHYCLETLPQLSQPTDINILEIFNSHLPSITEETKILSPFKTRGILLLKLKKIW